MSDIEKVSIEVALNRFTRYYTDMISMKQFDRLMMTVGEGEASILYNEDMNLGEMRKVLDNIFNSIKHTKRLMSEDIGMLHNYICTLMISLDSTEEDHAGVQQKIRTVNKWLIEMQVNVDEKKKIGDLLDYFKELEEIRAELNVLAVASEDIREWYVNLINNNKKMKKELESERAKNDKLEDKFNKVKFSFDDVKLKYTELYKLYTNLLDRFNRQVGENEEREKDEEKAREKDNKNNTVDSNKDIWFDIEKSQKRYEDLLNKHKDIIKDKDDLIRENEVRHSNDRARLIDLIEKTNRKYADLDKDLAMKDILVTDLKKDLEKMKNRMADKDQSEDEGDAYVKKQLEDTRGENQELKEEVERQRKEIEYLEGAIRELEDRVHNLDADILGLIENKVDPSDTKMKSILNDMKVNSKEGVEKMKELENKNMELINLNKQLQKQILDAQLEISSLLDKIKMLEGMIDNKAKEISNVNKMLNMRIKAEEGAYKYLISVKKNNETLKDRLHEKEALILQLQHAINNLNEKDISNANLIHRLKYDNNKFMNNYKITNSYNQRSHNDLPPTVSQHYHSPMPIPSFSPQKPLSPSKPLLETPEKPPKASIKRPEIRRDILFRCASKERVCEYISLDNNRYILNNLPTEQVLNPVYTADNIYTQHSLKELTQSLQSDMRAKGGSLFFIYGSPVNMRLYTVHKILFTFIDSQFASGVHSISIQTHKHIADNMIEKYTKVSFDDEEFSTVTVDVSTAEAVEGLKKNVFGILSTVTYNDLSVEYVHAYSRMCHVHIVNSEIADIKETVYTHVQDVLREWTPAKLVDMIEVEKIGKVNFVFAYQFDGDSSGIVLYHRVNRLLSAVHTNESIYRSHDQSH